MKSILITGASSGIGRALAVEYADEGARLILVGRNSARLSKAAEEVRKKGASAVVRIASVTNKTTMEAVLRDEAPEIVIACAGISGGPGGEGAESPDQARMIFDTNAIGVINTVAPALGTAKRIVIVSSMAGLRGLPTAPAYSASKCAVKAWGDALYGQGWPVTVVCPGFVKTPMTDRNGFIMPFLMDADKAARIIKRGADKGRRLVIFPFGMKPVAFFIKYCPEFILSRILSRLPKKAAIAAALAIALMSNAALAACPEAAARYKEGYLHQAAINYEVCGMTSGGVKDTYNAGLLYERMGQLRSAGILYRQTANQGLAPAQKRLGIWYRDGKGFPEEKDPVQAAMWFTVAAEPANTKWYLEAPADVAHDPVSAQLLKDLYDSLGQKAKDTETAAQALIADWRMARYKDYAARKLTKEGSAKFAAALDNYRGNREKTRKMIEWLQKI